MSRVKQQLRDANEQRHAAVLVFATLIFGTQEADTELPSKYTVKHSISCEIHKQNAPNKTDYLMV